MDHGGEAFVGFVIARRNPAERFDGAEEVFDEMAPSVHVKVAGNGPRPVGFGRDDRLRAPVVQSCPVLRHGVGSQPVDLDGLVGQQRGEIDVGNERRDVHAIVTLPRQQDDAHQIAQGIDQRHDLGCQTTARAADSLSLSPPLAPRVKPVG